MSWATNPGLLEIQHQGKALCDRGGLWAQHEIRIAVKPDRQGRSELKPWQRSSARKLTCKSSPVRGPQSATAQSPQVFYLSDRGRWPVAVGTQGRIIAQETQQTGGICCTPMNPSSAARRSRSWLTTKGCWDVEEAFCELKSYLEVRPVYHRRPDRVVNHVRLCFLLIG